MPSGHNCRRQLATGRPEQIQEPGTAVPGTPIFANNAQRGGPPLESPCRWLSLVLSFLFFGKRKGKKVYLLSNAQKNFTRPELAYLGIEKYFDGILISSEEGCKKPGKSFYAKLLERYHLNPKESIMIGNDSISDIRGSYEMGMDSLYIHTEISPECVEDLKSKYTIMDGDFRKVSGMILK